MENESNYMVPGGAQERAPFPTYVPIEDGVSTMISADNSREYVSKIFDVYVRDTPFTQTEILNLHEDLRDLAPNKITYKTATIRRVIWVMKKEGLIEQMDIGEVADQDRVFVWKPSVPEIEMAELDEKIPPPRRKRKRNLMKDPVSEFFADLMHYVFR